MRVFATKANVKTDILKRNDYDVLSKCKMALNHQCIVFNSLVKDNIVACVTWKMRNKYATCQTRFGFSGCFLNADHHRISRCLWFFALRKAEKKNARFFFQQRQMSRRPFGKRNDYVVLSKCKMALHHECIAFNSVAKSAFA